MNKYDCFIPGTKVILGKHRLNNSGNPEYWVPSMDKYVGRYATISKISHRKDTYGFTTYYVDIDNGVHEWRGINMKLLDEVCPACGKIHDQIGSK